MKLAPALAIVTILVFGSSVGMATWSPANAANSSDRNVKTKTVKKSAQKTTPRAVPHGQTAPGQAPGGYPKSPGGY